MKLNEQNYYNPKINKYLTNSKMRAFEQSPWDFYRRYVLGEDDFEPTPSMLIGSAVDCILTESWESFFEKYLVTTPKEELSQGTTRLTQAQHDKAVAIAKSVESQDAYGAIKSGGFDAQVILQCDMPDMGMWKGLAGKPDWLKIDDSSGTATIIDLKTSATIDPRKFHYHSLDYGYYRQAAMYMMMVRMLYPNIKQVINHLLVVENTGLFRVNVFNIDAEYLDNIVPYIYDSLQAIISKKKQDYHPQNLKWEDAIILPWQDNIIEKI